jgi:hypothetical protein
MPNQALALLIERVIYFPWIFLFSSYVYKFTIEKTKGQYTTCLFGYISKSLGRYITSGRDGFIKLVVLNSMSSTANKKAGILLPA